MEQEIYDREPTTPIAPEETVCMKEEYKPRKQELLREYEIRLRFLSVGCVVGVGCKEIPFRNVTEAMEEINKYISDPYEQGKRWRAIFDSEE